MQAEKAPRGQESASLERMPIFGCCASRRYVQRISEAGSLLPLGTPNGISALTTLEGELGLGRGVTAGLAEAVGIDAELPGHLQRQPLQRHHVDDWSQPFIDRRRFSGWRWRDRKSTRLNSSH